MRLGTDLSKNLFYKAVGDTKQPTKETPKTPRSPPPPTALSSSAHPSAGIQTSAITPTKKQVLSEPYYKVITDFVQQYKGLAIDCQIEMLDTHFTDVEPDTLKSILQTELGNRVRSQYHIYEKNAANYLKTYEEQAARSNDTSLLLNLAICESISPALLCRMILMTKYNITCKTELTRLLKFPYLIKDDKLMVHVMQCLSSDITDGPLVDLRRRILGEEYEVKLKRMADAATMHYYDENDLRRMSYEKTPDLKMILPFLYKGEVVYWIESKAVFGDVRTHKFYVKQQLQSYTIRFGPGIVIYWFGYHEETPHLMENSDGITVLHDFPDTRFIELFNIAELDEIPATVIDPIS